jgi:hypothetical protein
MTVVFWSVGEQRELSCGPYRDAACTCSTVYCLSGVKEENAADQTHAEMKVMGFIRKWIE